MAGENETKKKKDFQADIEHAGQLVLNVALPLSGTREKLEAMGRYDFIQQQKNNIKGYLADYLTLYGMSLDPKYNSMTAEEYDNSDDVERKEEEEKKNFMNSPTFNNMVDSRSPEELLDLLAVRPDPNKNKWEMRPPQELMEGLARQIETDNAVRAQTKKLLADIKKTQSKSITSKIKTFFNGNSKEYDNALKAMEDLSRGKISKGQAKDSIMAYLDIRKDKVRDHQYGRDRFDGFMQSLQSIMEPKEFEGYCRSVDAARRQRDPSYQGKTHPEDYMPAKKGEEHFAEMAKKAEDPNYTPTEREAARMMAITRLTNRGGFNTDLIPSAVQIRQETDRLMNDPESGFQSWYKGQTADDIKRLMSGSPRSRYNAAEEVTKKREQMLDQQQQQSQSRQVLHDFYKKQQSGPEK